MNWKNIFRDFERLRILIVGDVMIDSYVWGKVDRISPEAPVPVVNAMKQEKRLGGAGNVALNVQALGCTPILCSVVGQDDSAEDLKKLLAQKEMTAEGILQSRARVTTVKHRILAGSQHLLRIDSEITNPISDLDSERLVLKIKELAQNADVIIFEDYDKGVLTEKNIREIIDFAKERNIPTAVDPKKRNFLHYGGATLFKPNLKELKEGLKTDIENTTLIDLKKAVALLREQSAIENALITLSEKGVYIDTAEEQHLFSAHPREIADVSGAGDTVVGIAAACLALGVPFPSLAQIANLGGGLVCEHLGVVSVDKKRLLEEVEKLDKNFFTNRAGF